MHMLLLIFKKKILRMFFLSTEKNSDKILWNKKGIIHIRADEGQ